MVKKNRFDTIKLCQIVRKNLNGSEIAKINNAIENLIEVLYNCALVHGEENNPLAIHIEESVYRYEVLDMARLSIATNELRGVFMNEIFSRIQVNTLLCNALLGWKDVPLDESNNDDTKVGKKALTQDFRERVCSKYARKNYKQFRG